MALESEKYLQAEESAFKLEQALKELYQEAVNYKTSTRDLEAVRSKLVELIGSTQEISKNTHESVKVLNSIGGPEIISLINQLKVSQEEQKLVQTKRFKLVCFLLAFSTVISIAALTAVLLLVAR